MLTSIHTLCPSWQGDRASTPQTLPLRGLWAWMLVTLALGVPAPSASAEVAISEFMAINASGLVDQDGDRSDWIELHNASPAPVDLAGWHLTDTPDKPALWTFPAVTLRADGHLVVFASGKNRAASGAELHTNFKLSGDGEYLALVRPDGVTVAHEYAPQFPTQIQDVSYGIGTGIVQDELIPEGVPCRVLVPQDDSEGTHWIARAGFDDASWTKAVTGVGYGFGVLVTTDLGNAMRGVNDSAYVRVPFVVSEPGTVEFLTLEMKYDDGFAAYLNGVPAAVANVPPDLAWNSRALADRAGAEAGVGQSFVLPDAPGLLASGTNLLAVHGLNRDAAGASDDFLVLPRLLANRRVPALRFFAVPSPGAKNPDGSESYLAPVKFGVKPGFHDGPVTLSLAAAPVTAEIRYTLDGSVPTPSRSLLYTNAFTLTNTTVVRAVAMLDGAQPSRVATATYFVGEQFTLPVVSIAGAPADFNGPAGLYVVPRGTSTEKPVHIALYETNGVEQFAVDAGLYTHGGWTQTLPQRSLAVHLRRMYGAGRLNTRLFPEKDIESFNSFLLRSAGTDWGTSMLRDALMQNLGVGLMNIDYQAYRPAVLLVNGRFMGIQDIRESTGNHYPEGNHGADPERVDMIKYVGDYIADAGTVKNFLPLRNFMSSRNLNVATNYAHVLKQMDVDNFMDYQIVEIFSGNIDWPQNNVKLWREQKPGARWRWLFFDLDYAFGLFENTHQNRVDQDSVKRCTTTEEVGYPRDDESTFLIRRLLGNTAFRDEFIQRFAAHLNITFQPERVIRIMNFFQDRIAGEMPRQVKRWGAWPIFGPHTAVASMETWNANVEFMRDFARRRPGYIRDQLARRFGLAGMSSLTVHLSEPDAGVVILANVPLGEFPANGLYFNGVPLKLRALAAPGFRFVGWRGGFASDQAETVQTLSTQTAVTAVFERITPAAGGVVISELMYQPADPAAYSPFTASDLEFIELRNTSQDPLNLGGWRFAQGIKFDFPPLTLDPGQHLVVAANIAAFASRYDTNGMLLLGEYQGRLNGAGDRVALEASPWGPVMATVAYQDETPWPLTAAGQGFSLVAVDPNPFTDLDQPGQWRASARPGGSPGTADPATDIPRVVINELLSQASDGIDRVELHNPGQSPADIGGWFLTDSRSAPKKFRIPNDTRIPAGGFVTFAERDFNPVPGVGDSFAFSAQGEAVYLFSGDAATNLTGYSHGFEFGATAPGVSFGRHVTSVGLERFPAQARMTLLATNSGPRMGPVVINEILYAPPPGEEAFVELRNVTPDPVPLFDPLAPTNTWRVKGLGYQFPPGTRLNAHSLLLLVGIEPAAFRARYHVPDSVLVLGPYAGRLQPDGELFELQRPGILSAGSLPYVTLDEVGFRDRPPWPSVAAGGGASLHRTNPPGYGDDPAHWVAANPSPGAAYSPGAAPPVLLTQPFDQSVLVSLAVQFTASASGAEPFRYQWQHHGTNILGATNTALLLSHVVPADAGRYRVLVVDAAGSAASSNAMLTVLSPPTILVQPRNQNVRASSNLTFRVWAVSSSPLRYQWRFNDTDIPGATNLSMSLTNVQVRNQGRYAVTVSDSVGSVLSDRVTLNVLVAPAITHQPQSVVAVEGDTVSLSVGVSGSPYPISYRWRRNGAIRTSFLLDQSVSTLIITNVRAAQAGAYTVLITNLASVGLAGLLSSGAVLTVLADVDGDHLPDSYETPARGLDPGNPNDASLDFDGDGFTNLEEYRAGTDPNDLASHLRLNPLLPSTGSNLLSFVAMSNRNYTVQFRESPSAGLWTRLGDVFAAASNRTATVPDPYPASIGRIYRVVTPLLPPPAPGPVILVSPRSQAVYAGAEAVLEVEALGKAYVDYQWLFQGAPIAGATNASLALPNIQPNAAGEYAVALSDALGAVVSQPATVQVLVPPVILRPPASQAAALGQRATFTVEATGVTPLTYHWHFNGRPVRGATGPVLTLENVTAADAGSYVVMVKHQSPSGPAVVVSAPAVLRVDP